MQPKPSSGRHCLGARCVLIRSNGHPFVKINLRCHDFEIFARGKIGIVVKNFDYLVQREQRIFDTPVLAYFACECRDGNFPTGRGCFLAGMWPLTPFGRYFAEGGGIGKNARAFRKDKVWALLETILYDATALRSGG